MVGLYHEYVLDLLNERDCKPHATLQESGFGPNSIRRVIAYSGGAIVDLFYSQPSPSTSFFQVPLGLSCIKPQTSLPRVRVKVIFWVKITIIEKKMFLLRRYRCGDSYIR